MASRLAPVAALAERQLELIARMAALDPAPFLMGGFAEDALLAGAATRPHGDVDWILERSELDVRRRQAAALGFDSLETLGEAAPGEPFYLSCDDGDLRLEAGIADEIGGDLYLKIHSVAFDIDGRQPRVGYRFRLPDDTFSYPAVELEGVTVRVASPLCLYQLRAGIANQGTFGPLSELQLDTMARLRERFFPERSEEELVPVPEPLEP
jgi:hypothetical protein